MSNLPKLLIDLLCFMTIEPDGGHDIDDITDLQIDAWQTLIHDLTEEESKIIKQAAQIKLDGLSQIEELNPEQIQIVGILHGFINDELS